MLLLKKVSSLARSYVTLMLGATLGTSPNIVQKIMNINAPKQQVPQVAQLCAIKAKIIQPKMGEAKPQIYYLSGKIDEVVSYNYQYSSQFY